MEIMLAHYSFYSVPYDKLEKPLELFQIIILLLAILLFINNLELPAMKKYFNFRISQRSEIWNNSFTGVGFLHGSWQMILWDNFFLYI